MPGPLEALRPLARTGARRSRSRRRPGPPARSRTRRGRGGGSPCRSRTRGSGRASSGETSSPASSSTSPYQPSSPFRFAASVSWSVSSTTSARARAGRSRDLPNGPGAVGVSRVEVDHTGEVVHSAQLHSWSRVWKAMRSLGLAILVLALTASPASAAVVSIEEQVLWLRPELGRRGHAKFDRVTAQPGEQNEIAVRAAAARHSGHGTTALRSPATAARRTAGSGGSAAAASTAPTLTRVTATTRSPRASAGRSTAGRGTTRSAPAAPSRRCPADRARTCSTRPVPGRGRDLRGPHRRRHGTAQRRRGRRRGGRGRQRRRAGHGHHRRKRERPAPGGAARKRPLRCGRQRHAHWRAPRATRSTAARGTTAWPAATATTT